MHEGARLFRSSSTNSSGHALPVCPKQLCTSLQFNSIEGQVHVPFTRETFFPLFYAPFSSELQSRQLVERTRSSSRDEDPVYNQHSSPVVYNRPCALEICCLFSVFKTRKHFTRSLQKALLWQATLLSVRSGFTRNLQFGVNSSRTLFQRLQRG